MPDSYQTAKFLNDDDKELMRLRTIKHDRYLRLNESFDKHEVSKTFKDPKIYVFACIQFLGDIISFGISTFMPSLVRSFGFDPVLTQRESSSRRVFDTRTDTSAPSLVLTVPIFFVGVAIYICVSIWSDKVQKRSVRHLQRHDHTFIRR